MTETDKLPSPDTADWYDQRYFDPKGPRETKSGYDAGYTEKSMKFKFDFIAQLIYRYCLKEQTKKVKEIKVLELGGAKGLLAKRLNKFSKTTAINIDFSNYATQHRDPEAATVRGDLRALPFPNALFDTLVSCDVLEHLPPDNVDTALEEAYKVLKPGGNAFFMVSLKTAYSPIEEKSHLTLENRTWWLEKFRQKGFLSHENSITKATTALVFLQSKLKSPLLPWAEGIFILSKPETKG